MVYYLRQFRSVGGSKKGEKMAEIKNEKQVIENNEALKEKAQNKLKSELEQAKDKSFAKPVIEYLLKRCEEDKGVAEDVLLGHKTWEKCYSYIYEQARKQSIGNSAVVKDEVVYEWAEDYFHKDDKAEEEKKAKAAKTKEKPEMEKVAKKQEEKKIAAPIREEIKEKKKKHIKTEELEGQMSIFDMGL